MAGWHAAGLAAALAAGGLHVPSPDWRDQVVYFAMLDRFDDGEPSNNDQGVGEYDPADGRRYSGGDLAGLARRLDYIQGLGATALWITPPVAHQWWNPGGTYGGYHGYWASDFLEVDPHYGTLADYQALSRGLHGRGMFLVQDVVVNHVADWLRCGPGDAPPQARCTVRADARGRTAPDRPPFAWNDPRDPAHRAAGIYHWTPSITDFTDEQQERTFQLAGLDDLDTERPAVRRALRQAYAHWIRAVGVDAFRVDTAYHVPPAYFRDFLHADDADAPGIARVAAATGRHDFLAFGEGFGVDRGYQDTLARKLDAYMREPGGLPSMIDFPLYGTVGDVFARGRPSAELGDRIARRMVLHADPWRMPTFVDNHDVDRFLAGGSEAGLRQALLALMTLPGIPVVYYGTEQGFTARRASMFAGGHGSGGRDHFDPAAPMYRYLQRVIALRRGDRLFSRGTPTVLSANPAAAGALAWRMDHAGDSAFVVFNTADHAVLLDALDTGLPPGTVLSPVFSLDGDAPAPAVGRNGQVDVVLPPRAGLVWRPTGAVRRPLPPAGDAITLAPLPEAALRGDFVVAGDAPGRGGLTLVVDGRLADAQAIRVDPDGTWRATVATGGMVDPDVVHRVVAFDPVTGAVSAAQAFRVDPDWRLAADHDDPTGDDTGPTGTYVYPTDDGYAPRPGDIERVRAWTAGGALRIELTMRALVNAWNPPNGFDHVAFLVYLQLPGRSAGVAAMPGQRATLPDAMHWQVRLQAHGWSNTLFSFAGADARRPGTPVSPGAAIAVDPAARTVTFTLPATALGGPGTLDGARLHVTTWDQDADLRALAPAPADMVFGGGDPDGHRVMDAATVVLDGAVPGGDVR